MSEQDVETVRKAYDDFNSGNIDAVLAIQDPNVEWNEPGGGNAPSGIFNGPDAVRDEVFASVQQNFDEFQCIADEVHEDDGRIVATGRFTGKNKSGAELNATFTHNYEMKDGKITRFTHDVDREAWAAGWS
jgi:ketosteroid isomerase-like protein